MRSACSGALAAVLLSGGGASAQGLLDVCRALVNEQLINSSSLSVSQDTLTSRFSDFCSNEGSYASRFQGSSSDFQAGFSAFGRSLSLGAGSTSQSGFTEQGFREVCQAGSDSFRAHLRLTQSSSSGDVVAREFNGCIRTLAQSRETVFAGLVSQSLDGDGFTDMRGVSLRLTYQPTDEADDAVRVTQITGGLECQDATGRRVGVPEEGQSEVEPWDLQGVASLDCTIPEDLQGNATVEGFLDVEGIRTSYQRSIPYRVVNTRAMGGLQQEILSQIDARIAGLDTRLGELEGRLGQELPASLVAFFVLKECPAPWEPYTELAGRTILGAGPDQVVGQPVESPPFVIPQESLPAVGLQLASRELNFAPGQWVRGYGPPSYFFVLGSDDSSVVRVREGNDVGHTAPMGQGLPLNLPLPPHVPLTACRLTR